ncbi:MAG: PIN domain-containing protein [archaeon]
MKIALDTNLLLDMTRLKIDVFDQLMGLAGNATLVVPIQVRQELQTLSIERGKTGSAARVALEALSTHRVKTVSATGENGDEALQELAQKGYIIASNDRALRQSLKNNPQRAIVVRQSKYLVWQ